MSTKTKLVISAFIGIFMGNILPRLVFYTFFTTSAKSILVWGIVGVVLCFLAVTRKQSIQIAIVYMVSLVESFLFLGQLKFNSEFLKVALFLAIMGAVAAVCGLVMGFVTYYAKKFVIKTNQKNN